MKVKRWIALTITLCVASLLVTTPKAYADRIGFDNATTAASSSTTSSFTFSHAVGTCGKNRILFVNVVTYATSVSSVTYNGSGLTLIGSTHETYNNTYTYLYYMVAPATGTNDVVITLPSASWVHTTASSYTGANQSGVPDAYTTSTGQALNYSQSLTTVADNTWVVMAATNGNGRAVGAGTNTTLRGLDASAAEILVDSNGPVSPAGSRTLTVTGTYSTDYWAVVIASFKPAPNVGAEIGFDNATTAASNSTTSSFTFSHTVDACGTNRILFVSVVTYATSLTSVTYGGSYLTLIGSTHETYNNTYTYLYYMVAPATGANDVVISLPSASWVHTTASSYTGASQTDVPDAYTTGNGQALNYSLSVTTVANNSWVIMAAANGNGRAVGAGTDTTLRGLDAGYTEIMVDSNGPISPAGSRALTVTGTYSSDYWAVVIASFKPARIAYDNATTAASSSTTSSFSFSHAVGVNGINRILFVNVVTYATSVSSVTYNGSGLTLIGSTHETYNNSYVYLYYMVAPATGTNDVVISLPSASWVHVTAASYTGASQTSVPDAYAVGTGQALNFSQSLTTVADNSWVIMGASNANGRAVGAGTNTTLRGLDASDAEILVDSNGPVSPAGSHTLTVTGTYSTDYWAAVIASFNP